VTLPRSSCACREAKHGPRIPAIRPCFCLQRERDSCEDCSLRISLQIVCAVSSRLPDSSRKNVGEGNRDRPNRNYRPPTSTARSARRRQLVGHSTEYTEAVIYAGISIYSYSFLCWLRIGMMVSSPKVDRILRVHTPINPPANFR